MIYQFLPDRRSVPLNPLMSRSFWVKLKPSRCFLWEVVAVWSSGARKSWNCPILQISQNMMKLAILAALTNFVLPALFFELHHSNFRGSITIIIWTNKKNSKLQFFSHLVPSRIIKTLRVMRPPPPPNSYHRSNTPTVIGLNWDFFQRFAKQYYSTLMYCSDEEDETDEEDINEWTRCLAWIVTIDFVIRFIIFKL